MNVALDTHAGHQSITLEIEGDGADKLKNEAGGHRLQRISPTERRGRVHSSTVTVAVLGEGQINLDHYLRRDSENYSIEWFSGTGCGGQHRNKHQNSARITHIPTGITKSAQTRSRQNSMQEAMEAINKELDKLLAETSWNAKNDIRRDQVGTGERSDKRRTIRFQYDEAVDHLTGKRMTSKEYMRGGMDKLW